MIIASLDDVRPGDIMICSQADAPARILVNFGQLLLKDHYRDGEFSAGHAGVIVSGRRLVEAMPSGARVRSLRETDWSVTHRYFRLSEDYLGQADDAAFIAEAMVGIPYSFMSYVYLAAHLAGVESKCLENHIDRRQPFISDRVYRSNIEPAKTIGLPVEAICSVLAEQSWTLTGKKVIRGTKPQIVTPGMLARQLSARPDVIRGGLGLI